MTRLPQIGGDSGSWGDVLNDFLRTSHDEDGTLKPGVVGAAQLKPMAVTDGALANDAIQEVKLAPDVRQKLNSPLAIADGSVGTSKLADNAVTREKAAGFGAPQGFATLDADGHLADTQIPAHLRASEISPRATANEPLRGAGGGYVMTTNPLEVIGLDSAGLAYCNQSGTLRRVTSLATSWANVTTPTNTTAATCRQVYPWRGYLYAVFQDASDSRWKVYRAAETTGTAVLSWSAPLLTLTLGAEGYGFTITGTSQAILVGEYGDPVTGATKAANVWRSTDGTTFAVAHAFGSAVRHVHAVAADPYIDGHVWVAFGDNIDNCYAVSEDHGATWTDLTCSMNWQGVQLSFTEDHVYIAPDARAPTSALFVIDKATHEFRLGSLGTQRSLNIFSPGTYNHGVTTSGSTTFLAGAPDNWGPFVASDVGRRITGAGIPAGTTITAFSGTANVTLSAVATATATGVRFTIERPERSNRLTFFGAVDPQTGIYYGVTNSDGSDVTAGDLYARPVMFMIPYVGGPVIKLDEMARSGPAVVMGSDRIFYGNLFRGFIRG